MFIEEPGGGDTTLAQIVYIAMFALLLNSFLCYSPQETKNENPQKSALETYQEPSESE